MPPEPGEHQDRGLRRVAIGDTSRTAVLFPGVRLNPAYLDPKHHEEVQALGRARIVESKPPGRPAKYLVIRGYEAPTEQHHRLNIHRLDPVGEARMLLEIRRRMSGSPVTAVQPIAVLFKRGKKLRGAESRQQAEFVSEYAPGIQLPMKREFEEVGPELDTVHGLLRRKGIDPIDLHGRNVLFDGKRFVVIDAKHSRLLPDDPLYRKLEQHRLVQAGLRGDKVYPLRELERRYHALDRELSEAFTAEREGLETELSNKRAERAATPPDERRRVEAKIAELETSQKHLEAPSKYREMSQRMMDAIVDYVYSRYNGWTRPARHLEALSKKHDEFRELEAALLSYRRRYAHRATG